MHYVYIALIIALTIIVAAAMVLNLQSVTVSLFFARVTMPLFMLVLAVYILGMLTGGFVVSLIRRWIKGATRR